MDLEHHFTVDAPVETVWSTMMDLEKVAECFPGATLTEANGDSFEGTVKVKLGPIAMVYKGGGSFTEKDESARRAVIEAKGRDKRGNGTAGADVVMTMTSEGAGTRVDVRTDLNVTGKPAQFGRGVMQDVSDKLLGQFTECLAGRFDGSAGGAAPDQAAAPASAPAAAAPAVDDSAAASGSSAPAAAGATAAAAGAAGAAGAAAGAAGAAAPAAAGATPAAPGADRPPRPETPTDTSSSAQPGGGAATASSGAAGRGAGSSSAGSDDAIDLGGMLVPSAVRTYLPYAAAGVVGLVVGARVGWKLGHWFGRHSKKNRKADSAKGRKSAKG